MPDDNPSQTPEKASLSPPARPAPADAEARTATDAPEAGRDGIPGPYDRPWNWFGELRLAVVFLTILPIRLRPQDQGYGVSHAVRAFPVAALAVGATAAIAFTLADLSGLAPLIAALIALAAAAVMSGGLHEDGLADTADGLSGAGRTRERRLAIMRDSAIGAHGALALILAVAIRASAISYTGVTLDTVCALIGAAVASRTAIAPVMFLLPPARTDGLSFSAGIPNRSRTADAVAIGILLTALALAPVAQPMTILLVLVGTAAGAAIPALLARKRLGGQTGDVLGAVQQCAEIGFLLVFIADP
jgi:adenosylcobinamide-GDP ribazoletransferase